MTRRERCQSFLSSRSAEVGATAVDQGDSGLQREGGPPRARRAELFPR